MVVAQVSHRHGVVAEKEVVGLEPQEEYYTPISQKLMEELQALELHYPGWEKDYNAALEFFDSGSENRFRKTFRKVRDKQRVYDDYKAFARLNELASLELSYPGSEPDKQAVEAWHLQNPSNDDTDVIFFDKIEGLRNKDNMYNGDRSHPNIQDLDALDLTYPEWEEDYQDAVAAHCDTPARSFPNALHRLRQRQKAYEGDESHWRLVELKKLRLTYPGWEQDVDEVREWHFRNAETVQNDKLYAEVLEGMRDQQLIYLGWDHDEDEDQSIQSNSTNETFNEQGSFYKLEYKGANQMKKSYDSITESLNSVEGMKKKLAEERFTDTPEAPTENDTISRLPAAHQLGRPPSSVASARSWAASLESRKSMDSTGPPPKQVKLGSCEVCYSRPKTHVFVPCGHLSSCAACSHKAMEMGCCPICRRHADSTYRVFLT